MPPVSDFIRQVAAIPVRDDQVCLVTSSSGKRWVVPKGCMEAGITAGEMALTEAWEEAGLVGRLHPDPVGTYLYQKYGNLYHVTVFRMDVTEVAADWPEQGLRQRVWLAPERALALLDEPGLRDLVRGVMAERRELSA